MGDGTAPLRIGVLGAARIAGRAIAEPARATGAHLVTVAARDRDRAAAWAAEHGVEQVASGYADVLAHPDVEVVYNPLPNGLHAPWNLAAVAAGKHVLSEKPFAANASEAEQVRDAGREAGVVVSDGFHYLYHPVMQRLLELLASGELGELRHVEAVTSTPAPDDGDPRWSFDLAGGALMDLGCYSLHAVRVLGAYAGGEPSFVSATADERAGAPGVDERLHAELGYPSGATAAAGCDMAASERDMHCRVVGTLGEAVVTSFVQPHLDDRLVVRTASGERSEHLGTRSSYTYQLEAMAAAVRHRAPMPTDADDAVATMRLIDGCYVAAGLPLRRSTQAAGLP